MSNSNITVIGNLVADAEKRSTKSAPLTKLRIATNERVKDASGNWKDGDTTFIDVACWRRLAEGAASLRKGQRVVIYGKLKGRSYEKKDGTNAYAYEIDADDIGTSLLSRAVADPIAPDKGNPWG